MEKRSRKYEIWGLDAHGVLRLDCVLEMPVEEWDAYEEEANTPAEPDEYLDHSEE